MAGETLSNAWNQFFRVHTLITQQSLSTIVHLMILLKNQRILCRENSPGFNIILKYNPLINPSRLMYLMVQISERMSKKGKFLILFWRAGWRLLEIKNFGFAEGNNIGIRFVREKYHPKYIFLLNNDTSFIRIALEISFALPKKMKDSAL